MDRTRRHRLASDSREGVPVCNKEGMRRGRSLLRLAKSFLKPQVKENLRRNALFPCCRTQGNRQGSLNRVIGGLRFNLYFKPCRPDPRPRNRLGRECPKTRRVPGKSRAFEIELLFSLIPL